MCDRGICVTRTRSLEASNGKDRMIVRFDKCKDEESMGRQDNMAFIYDRERMDITFDAQCTDEIREKWKF
jgi:hypothetical protein